VIGIEAWLSSLSRPVELLYSRFSTADVALKRLDHALEAVLVAAILTPSALPLLRMSSRCRSLPLSFGELVGWRVLYMIRRPACLLEEKPVTTCQVESACPSLPIADFWVKALSYRIEVDWID
jgi:hypothetical protein